MEQNINRHIPHIQYNIIVYVVSCFILYTYGYIVIIWNFILDISWHYHSESLNTRVYTHGVGCSGRGRGGPLMMSLLMPGRLGCSDMTEESCHVSKSGMLTHTASYFAHAHPTMFCIHGSPSCRSSQLELNKALSTQFITQTTDICFGNHTLL